jgi:succinate dehydrogenase / fumarate reductase membrane anchor subunit
MREQRLWTWHIFAGAIILVFLGLHMAVMHLDAILGIGNPAGGHPIDWANVVARARQTGFTVSYIVLLAAALFHGLYGLRNILHEFGLSKQRGQLVSWGLAVMGVVLFVFGTWAALASSTLARTM